MLNANDLVAEMDIGLRTLKIIASAMILGLFITPFIGLQIHKQQNSNDS